MLADVDRHYTTIKDYRNSRWRPEKPEVEITFKRQMIAPLFQRLSPYYRPRPTSLCHCEHCLTLSATEIQDGGHQTGSGNNFRAVSDGATIPTSTPIFSAMADSGMTLLTLCDIARHCQTLTNYQKSRWRQPKPEMEINIERTKLATRF
jgi:hypothetical protein